MSSGPETRLVAKIRKELEQRGCLVIKMHGNRFMPAGLPDLIVVRDDGVVVWVEVKVPGRTDGPRGDGLSALQWWWLDELARRGTRCGSADSVEAAIDVVFAGELAEDA